jgi:hypothetical protein
MENRAPGLTYTLLAITGGLLIIASFFVLVPQTLWDSVFYLNIGVGVFIYLVIIQRYFALWGGMEQFESKIAGIGIFWFFSTLYTVLAVSGLIYGANYLLPFKVQLLYQAIFVFVFLVGLNLANSSARYAVSVSSGEQNLKQGVRALSETVISIEMAFNSKNLNWKEEQQLISKVKEKVRFLTTSNNANAKVLESDFITEGEQILSALRSPDPDQRIIISKLYKCDNLLDQRKQFFTN